MKKLLKNEDYGFINSTQMYVYERLSQHLRLKKKRDNAHLKNEEAN